MPTFITTTHDEPFMSWIPGCTETQERAERLARSISEQCSVEEIEESDSMPFAYLD